MLKISEIRIGGLTGGCVTDGKPNISFTLESDATGEELKYAVIRVGDWYKETVDQINNIYNGPMLPFTEYKVEGFPVFILKYRTGNEENSREQAQQDTAATMRYIFSNLSALGIVNENYSMWGFSAGGLVTYQWTEGNVNSCSSTGIPAPRMIALVYGALWEEYESNNPQTAVYMCYGKNDGLIGDKGIEWCKEHETYLQSTGRNVRFDLFENAPHGFGDGRGTDAENWIGNAVEFWNDAEKGELE